MPILVVNTSIVRSEIVVRNGAVYHLGLRADQLASKIIFVGDPARTHIVASFFDSRECEVSHREYVTITGTYGGKRISVIGTGMSTDNVEIALAEIYTLVAFNLNTQVKLTRVPPVHIIRVGTSGGTQDRIPAGTIAVSQYAVGLDSTGLYYESVVDEQLLTIEKEVRSILNENTPTGFRFKDQLPVYASGASPRIFQGLQTGVKAQGLEHVTGVTVTTPGFYGPSARKIQGITNTVEDIKSHLGRFEVGDLQIVNMDMETSLLFHLGGILGFHCGTICPIISGPSSSAKPIDYAPLVRASIEVALDVLVAQD